MGRPYWTTVCHYLFSSELGCYCKNFHQCSGNWRQHRHPYLYLQQCCQHYHCSSSSSLLEQNIGSFVSEEETVIQKQLLVFIRVYLQHWFGDDLGFDNLKGVFLFF